MTLQAPSPKFQASEKLQTSNCKVRPAALWRVLVFGVWCLFAAWSLELGASAATNTTKVAPVTPEAITASINRAVDFLVRTQNKDGSWGSAQNTKDLNIFAPVPGAHHAFRCGVTAMCVEALIECAATNEPARQALERAESYLLEELPKVRRADSIAIYNVWTHAYGIQALVDMHRRSKQDEQRLERIQNVIRTQIDLLRRYESVDGGWGYYDFRVGSKRPAASSTSFVTATVLIAFNEARQIGIEIPEDLVSRGVASIRRQQKNDMSYMYGEYLKLRPMMDVNRPGGSLGRSQACNLSLKLWGETNITTQVFTNWLDRLIARNDWLSFGRKRPVPHESWFQVAGYFFYYGHYYAALVVEQLPTDLRPRYKSDLAKIMVPLQEKDGSWWDFPFYNYHQPYGTAFGIMTLTRCRPG